MTPETPSIPLEEDTSALVLKSFPEGLRRQVKSQAAAEGKTLKDYVIEALNERVGNIPDSSSPQRDPESNIR
jgi:predicted HicB family RNase H-like nuclease